MALIVEDGTGVVGANSYIESSYADTYHTDRNNAAWGSASTASKTAALLKATRYIDTHYAFATGLRTTHLQGLMWPRKMALDFEGFTISGVPTAIKDATSELALFALTDDLTGSQDRETLQETVGPVSVTYRPGAEDRKTYPTVTAILVRFGIIEPPGLMKVIRS